MKINPTTLEKKLKLKFSDQKIFIKSLTHKSFDSINNNEKIEFLGDRVLGLIIAKKLLELYPEEEEGGDVPNPPKYSPSICAGESTPRVHGICCRCSPVGSWCSFQLSLFFSSMPAGRLPLPFMLYSTKYVPQ